MINERFGGGASGGSGGWGWSTGSGSGSTIPGTPKPPPLPPSPAGNPLSGLNTGGASGFNINGGASSNMVEVTNLINSLNLAAQQTANRGRIPDGSALEAQSSQNIASQLSGQLPPDVMRMMQQQSAERGVSQGVSGSPNDSAAYLRALGLSSLDMQNQGQQHLSAATARNPAAPLYDPSQMVLSPYQSGQLINQNQGNQLQSGQLDLSRWVAQQNAAAEQSRISQSNQQIALAKWDAEQKRAADLARIEIERGQLANQTMQTNKQYGLKEYSKSYQPIGPGGEPFGEPKYSYQYWM